MIVPIGVDCGLADFIKKHNLRSFSFPFDWTVTYNGVSSCINDDFKSFTEPLNKRINQYDMYFHHDFVHPHLLQKDTEKYVRRYNRFMELCKSATEELIFIRKGHAPHHHQEHNGKYTNITSDLEDAENLDLVLQTKYPNLKYKIIVILVCGDCFHSNQEYTSKSNRIEIHNIASTKVDDDRFDKLCRTIFQV
jgi:hypothetical protein